MVGTDIMQYLELAYARVSTKGQNLDRQEASILEAVPDLKIQNFFKDKYTGKEFDRPEYLKLKNRIEDILEINPDIKIRVTIHELDRIGRDFEEIQKEIAWFENHGVTLRFLDIPEDMIGSCTGITGQLLYRIIILLKAYWAEQELHYKEKRTREGIERAHAAGVKFGRKAVVLDEKSFRAVADKSTCGLISHTDAMKLLDIKPYLYWKHIKLWYPTYKGKHSGN